MEETKPKLTAYSLDPRNVHQNHLVDIAHNVGYFEENHYLRLGDADSGHGVLFGNLHPYGAVAIKPHETVGRAMHEREVMVYAAEKGIDTLETLDIAAQGIYAYLITRYRPELRHLGQFDWNENVASRRLRKVVSPTLHFAANFAGQIHSKGMTHGDFQVKNVAITRDGEPVFSDVENGQIRLKGNELKEKGNRDLIRFSSSLLRRGLLYDRSIKYRLNYLGDEFVDPAIEAEGVQTTAELKNRRTEVLDKIGSILVGQARAKHPAGKSLKLASIKK
jgi:tRNA A-37 threonylcarbamoyl transferase component Bud32